MDELKLFAKNKRDIDSLIHQDLEQRQWKVIRSVAGLSGLTESALQAETLRILRKAINTLE